MIPKVIHYCWFSRDKKPQEMEDCLDSWRRVMPEYEIKCWDSKSFDFNSVPFVKDAFQKKKWSYVTDYIRLYAIYTEGGIYMDTDVKVFKSFDYFLNDKMFIGLEGHDMKFPQAAIFGAERGNIVLGEMLHSYYAKLTEPLTDDTLIRICKFDAASFSPLNVSGKLQTIIVPALFDYYFKKYGFKAENIKQELDVVTIYPIPIFTDKFTSIDDTTYASHLANASWINPLYRETGNIKGKIYLFCKKHRLFKPYALFKSFKTRFNL